MIATQEPVCAWPSWLRSRYYRLLLRGFPAPNRFNVIFDGQCRLYRRTARTLRALDWAHRLREGCGDDSCAIHAPPPE